MKFLAIFSVILLVILILSLFPKKQIEPNETPRKLIERQHPEFKDFEKQKSFAGKEVKTITEGDTTYIIYITNGSGLPIIEAKCFSVTGEKVSEIGVFPNPIDSYMGYRGVDPKTCKGIK